MYRSGPILHRFCKSQNAIRSFHSAIRRTHRPQSWVCNLVRHRPRQGNTQTAIVLFSNVYIYILHSATNLSKKTQQNDEIHGAKTIHWEVKQRRGENEGGRFKMIRCTRLPFIFGSHQRSCSVGKIITLESARSVMAAQHHDGMFR